MRGSPAPRAVELVPAGAAEAGVVANVLELYFHDMSEFFDVPLPADGRFGYPPLQSYWRDEGRHPFLLRAGGELAGLALVARGSRTRDDPGVWDLVAFFVVRRHRKRGVGAEAAREVWRRFPGAWEVRVLEANRPALAFWRSAVARFAPAHEERGWDDAEGKAWRVFSFVSP